MKLENAPHMELGRFPTSIDFLNRLTVLFDGPRIYMKRDDETGLAFGGNKVRKLSYLIAEAMEQGADTVITAGAVQSHHCRLTAAAAVRAGMNCELVLGGSGEEIVHGNLFLDQLFGAVIHWTPMERRGERLLEVAELLKQKGRNPYVIPYGGSNEVGAVGYVAAMLELKEQMRRAGISFDRIIVASSSGGTQAGMTVGARIAGFEGRIIGISIDKGERDNAVSYETELKELSNKTSLRLGLTEKFVESDFTVVYDYLGKGYGVVGDPEREAVRMAAGYEAILLDPVYTGRAFGAMIDMIRKKMFPPHENILFWHTGGQPALFTYAGDIMLP